MSKRNVSLNNLTSEDAYSLILFALFKLKEVPEYSTLSELAYLLDKESLLKFLKYFENQTITIPSIRDLKLSANCLLLYQRVNIEGKDFSKAINSLDINNEYNLTEIKKMYFNLCKVLENYSFNRS